jgi:hypothetical protein
MSDISEDRSGGRPGSATPYPAQQPPLSDSSTDKLSELKDKAADDFTQVRQAAENQAQAAKDMAAEKATEQKNFLARQLSSVAQALEKAGSELEHDNQQEIGKYTRDLGSSAKRIAEDIRDRDIGEVAAIAEDFGRKQPVAFLGLAALAGFAASRFVTASAQRRPSDRTDAYAMNRDTASSQQGMTGADTSFSRMSKGGSYNG